MAVISVRLNAEEEKILEYLSDYYEEEKSTLIKHSLKDLYEDLVDSALIKDLLEEEKKSPAVFVDSTEVLKTLE
jgi:predicted DNA-binding protein